MAFVGERGSVLPTDARAERLLVALTPSWDLFVHATDLFVEATPLTWLHTQHSGAGGFSKTGSRCPVCPIWGNFPPGYLHLHQLSCWLLVHRGIESAALVGGGLTPSLSPGTP